MSTTYAVIGGGIAGASVAYHLSQRTGDPVTVFERGSLLEETTAKSFALFGYYGDPLQYRMKRYAMTLYNEFMANPYGNPRYYQIGRLGLSTSSDEAARLRDAVQNPEEAESRAKVGTNVDRVPVEYIDADDLHELLVTPLLNTSAIEGAIHRPNVGYFPPTTIAGEFVERARENGVTFREGTTVTDVLTTDGRVSGLDTSDGEVDADEVVCTAGPWNVLIARQAGIGIPVRHTLAPALELEPIDPLPHTLTSMKEIETGYSFRGDADNGTVFVGNNPGGWEAGTEYDPSEVPNTVPDDIREGCLNTVSRLFPSLATASVVDEWVGVRSVTPDGNPVVGRTSLPGFSLVAFSTSGIQLSPAAGYVVANQLLDDDPTDFYDGLSITRFEGYDDTF